MVPLPEIRHQGTQWDPRTMEVTLNARLDAKLIPQDDLSMRLNYSHIVVMDNFIGEAERQALLDFITEPDWDHDSGPPVPKWERETADGADMPKTWGLKDSVLQDLAKGDLPAMQEVHARLAKLYPDYIISHMPSSIIQQPPPSAEYSDPPENWCCMSEWDEWQSHMEREMKAHERGSSQIQAADANAIVGQPSSSSERGEEEPSSKGAAVDCNQFVGNAAVYGDDYSWHVDADPSAFPESPWTDAYGQYCNGEPGRPLLVSLLLYLDERWHRRWNAETLFLDDDTDIGFVVRPKRFRAVLMDQDVLHRVSTPPEGLGAKPRYSLVWKLVFTPRIAGQQCCIAKPAWGPPTALGSAARVNSIQRSMLLKRKAVAPPGNIPLGEVVA